jgi:hypothetical protein
MPRQKEQKNKKIKKSMIKQAGRQRYAKLLI